MLAVWFFLVFGLLVAGAFGLVVYLLLFLRLCYDMTRANVALDSVLDGDKKYLMVDD